MPVPNQFANVTTSIPLSQLDANFNTPITLGNTAIQLGNTVTTLNNMTLANVTISSGNVTITNVSVTTANVTTANITTAIIGTANVTTANVTTGIIGTANVTTGNITTAIITTANVATANITTSQILNYGTANSVVYLNSSKAATANTGLQFDGTNLGLGVTPSAWKSNYRAVQVGNAGQLVGRTDANQLYAGSNWFVNSSNQDIYQNNGNATIYAQNSGSHIWYTAPSGTAGNAITFTQAMTLDASGNLGIGTTSPSFASGMGIAINGGAGQARLVLKNNNTGDASTDGLQIGVATDSSAFIEQRENSHLFFATNAIERARITSGGDFYIGQTTVTSPPTTGADVLAGGLVINPTRRTTASAANCNWDATTGNFARSTSSLRYKKDVEDANFGLADVLRLRAVTYKGKAEADGDKVFAGFIAEEIDEIGLDVFVEYDSENNPDSLAYPNMVALLAKAIQELKAELDATKAKVAALENA